MIDRLHSIVIKTGLKRISVSYSRISLPDIREKLNLDRSSDIEQIVARV